MTGRRWLMTGGGTLAAALVAGFVWLMVAAAGAKCPAGQHEVFQYFQPIVTVVNKTPIVTEIPIYRCQS